MPKAKKVFVGNYKGGVGKTTSIYQIALHMVESGKKVLLIDLDPQCSLSEICLARTGLDLERLKDHECLNYVYDIWIQKKHLPTLHVDLDKKPLIKETEEGVHFIPSNLFYSNGGLDDLAQRLKDDFYDLLTLQQFFKYSHVEDDFDYVLFDCPPSNNIITQGAFLLSDYYIIPSIIQPMSIRGVVHYIKTVDKIYKKKCKDTENAILAKELFGEKPELLGIFETLKRGTVNNDTVLNDLNQHLTKAKVETLLSSIGPEKYVFDTAINNYEHIARATENGKKAVEYKELTKEILNCIEQKPIKTLIFSGGKRWLK
ncbi:cellulose biosynthesis protein BcsQ [Bacillus mesophilus]|uniref:AAA family ATPase n=1 Tax=Bacillus mesophilus TaxID=1808955 RepID=A0A6M0Q838_9BACI|nr:AAA family ATPase [Bacillus mesophilus]MBM7662126.1 cellulose biosynthesis protein BcsQ [Bacillus mesophilus]NEY72521.1 AAA family ATPase [Bacillus mesophilus]